MSKFVKRLLIALITIGVLGWASFRIMKIQTKKASPQETVTYYFGDLEVEIDYSRPSKKGREIFGGLVPYGRVWRTGANEATTFAITRDIVFGSTPVKAGKYTLWTLPGPDQWEVYLNGKMYGWGVDFDEVAQRDPAADVAKMLVPVRHLQVPVEQFTIAVDGTPMELTLTWDDVQVGVPITH